MIPTFVGNMLYTSPAFLAINIRLQELPWRWWNNLWFHGQKVNRRKWLKNCRIINCSNCKRSGVQYTFHLCHECSERLCPGVINKDDSIALADWICLSHTPPVWLASGGLLCHLIQSPPCSYIKDILSSSISS